MRILSVTSRTITLELDNNLPYYSENDFSIYLNNEFIRKENRNVFTIFDLTPNQKYSLIINEELIEFETLKETVALNIKDFNAIGDGISDDTVKIQAAIACCPKNGTVYIPKGTYLISCIFLKSDMMLYFESGTKIITKHERNDYPILPGEVDNFNFGTWEGSMVSNFASSITAINVSNLVIAGNAEIDENAHLGDWYINHRVKRIAWRGYGMYFKDCNNVSVIGIYIHNTPSWNIHPFFSNNLKFLNMRIENNPNMPTTDGLDPDCCNEVLIAGCKFNVGDDCIAIKSGTLDLAKKFKRPSSNIIIRNNLMEKGHGGVVFGSELSGGIENITVEKCLFKNTDRGLRIKTRRGRGRIGIINNVLFNNIKMENVLTPFVINMYYNMGPAGGHEEYVWTTKLLPVDDRTPYIGHFKFSNIECSGVGYAAGVFLGLPEAKIGGVEFENVKFNYNNSIEAGYPVMIEHNFKLKNAGLYCFNIDKVITNNVEFNGNETEEIINIESEI